MFSKFKLLRKSIALAFLLCCMITGVNAQSYVEIGTGTVSSQYPPYGGWKYAWCSMLHTQATIGAAKSITKIAFNYTDASPKTFTSQKIYLKHTTLSVFADASYENPTSTGYTLVYDGPITFTNGWSEIVLSTPFAYNGTDNLIVHYENRYGTAPYGNFAATTSIIGNNKASGSDVSFPTSTGYLNPYPSALPNIRFYYASTGPVTPNTPIPSDNQDKASASNALSFNLGANTTTYDLYFGTDSLNVLNLNAAVKVVSNATVAAAGTYNYPLPNLLTSKTKYFWRVVAKNGAQTENSPLWKFTTELIIASFPYNQGFEDSTVFYPGWYGSFTDWAYPTTGANAIWHTTTTTNSGANAAFASPTTITTISAITTPRFNLPANYRISYWWKCTAVSGTDTTFFEVSTNGGTSWTVLDVLSPTSAMPAYVQRFQNLTGYAGNNVKFQWRYKRGATSSLKECYLDDIKVEAIPTGASMTLNVTALNFNELYVNGTTKMRIAIGNIGTSNLVVSGVTVAAPFSCAYTGTILPGASDTTTVVFTATTVGTYNENLTINSNGTGNNTIALSGNVLALLPNLFETFESTPVNSIPAHWNKLKSKDPYQTVNDIKVMNSTYDAHSVPNVVKFYNNTDTISPLMLITPGLTNFANDSLKFWASKTIGTTNTVQLIVGLMDNPYDGASFVPVQTFILADTMVQYTMAFNTSNTKPYIAFKHGQNSSSKSIWLDDVSWQGSVATVPSPAAVIAPLNSSINAVAKPILKWTPTSGNPTGYRLSVGSNNPPTNIINNVDLGNQTSYTITTALAYNTTYYWKVTPYNATGDAVSCSVWSFTTMADPTITSLPWTEGFESVTPTSNNADFPLGWSIENGGMQSSYWDIITNNATYPDNAHTGQKAMNIMFSMLGSNNDWLFTPPVHLTGGTAYDFSFWYKAPIYVENGDTTSEKLAVYWGTAADSAAMTSGTIFKNEFLRIPAYVQYTKKITPPTTGNYTFGFYSYSDVTQWITFVDDVKIDISTGIDESSEQVFKIYPNPSNGEVVIKLNNNNNETNVITIHNLLGQEIYLATTNRQINYVNLSDVEKGIYLVKISNKNTDTVKKLIIK
ncbi:MAG: T9SS type A sorting domain-containing protein [Bacteroidetes bacterium]|nr:T9SS type A sorting domain-containing protein [Bacteroidota bacterium]